MPSRRTHVLDPTAPSFLPQSMARVVNEALNRNEGPASKAAKEMKRKVAARIQKSKSKTSSNSSKVQKRGIAKKARAVGGARVPQVHPRGGIRRSERQKKLQDNSHKDSNESESRLLKIGGLASEAKKVAARDRKKNAKSRQQNRAANSKRPTFRRLA